MKKVAKHFILPPALVLLIIAFLSRAVVQAHHQSGFDCGLPENKTYADPVTGIKYKSDAAFIDTGISQELSEKEGNDELLWHLRSFPQGVRNCYTINVGRGQKYLIRTRFFYGNYDNKNEFPEFDLYLGVSYWDTINPASEPILKEIIHVVSTARLRICLVNKGKGAAFISAIELRPMQPNHIYNNLSGGDQSLLTLNTRDMGNEDDVSSGRYQEGDIYEVNKPDSHTKHEEVEAMMKIKFAYGVTTRNWQGDPCAPEAFNWDGVKCAFDTSNTSNIISLNLSSAELSGIISPDLSSLKLLQVMDLSYNTLVGPVPDFLADFPFLKVINLSENNLTGAIPAKLVQKSKRGSLSLSLDGNPYLCQKEPCNYPNKEGREGTKDKDVTAIAAGTAIGSLLIILFAVMVIFCHLRLGRETSETILALLHNPHVMGVHRKGWIEI